MVLIRLMLFIGALAITVMHFTEQEKPGLLFLISTAKVMNKIFLNVEQAINGRRFTHIARPQTIWQYSVIHQFE
ncbi:hypothetical protein MAR_028036 [Mya arenaria]|uniref:Uncharacterized protein n=1 Tax=Mya arenaria TaxID=6604 RepID=A0ABY7DFE6_MYAAR|nr:hypothetical protein MAR_028036 [Mya arenaria]